MENSDPPKARRPLPVPGVAPQRPASPAVPSPTPATGPTYASPPKPPPPLPIRPQNTGSAHTAYVPPPFEASVTRSPGFREPELVADDTIADDESSIPDLLPSNDTTNWTGTPYDTNAWNSESWNNPAWDNTTPSHWAPKGATSSGFEAMDYMGTSRTDQDFIIDGRDNHTENNWWNPDERAKAKLPGQGMLAPVLADSLHDPHHSLYSVLINSFPGIPAPQPNTPGPAQSSSAQSPPHSDTAPPPSESEVRASVPHPNAYYCSKDNGWVILSWKSSSVVPPLAQSYVDGKHPPLPDQGRRRRTQSCVEDDGQPFGKPNKTHHFHKYEKAFDSLKLTPPFRQDEWQSLENVKQKRRVGAVMGPDVDISSIKPDDIEMLDDKNVEAFEEEGKLWDLYVCCQCSLYVVASSVIPGVIPRKHIDELIRDKKSHPSLGKTAEQSVIHAFETFLTALENKLWKGNNRMIKVSSSGFQSKVGWNSNVKKMFELLGFAEEVSGGDTTLKPPSTDVTSTHGKLNRRKLLRAWLEFGSYVADYKRAHAFHFKDWKDYKIYVQLDSAREMYQTAIGAHPDQIARGGLSDTMLDAVRILDESWKGLGLTPTTFSAELLGFAYLAQCRCDPAGTAKYFTYFTHIVKALQEYGSCPPLLQELCVTEQSRDRFTLEDVNTAATMLGFGAENVLRVDYDEDVPDEFIENAWRTCVKRSWLDLQHGSETLRHANDSFRILAETRGSVKLWKLWENGKSMYMNPDRAYSTLEVPKEVDDTMLITVYSMRLEETPSQLEKMREAMSVIAEVRNSERLKQFISTGMDPGDIVAPADPDLPRGLNQLGNTCYLNSLLQYFYTIKDLREAVLPMSKMDVNALNDEKFSDEDLKRYRVGGRLVTRREIVRSRKFINQLAELFFHLEYSESAAVTPTIELAKLALVTSRDEEEDEIDKGGTESSNDTDATLVEDGVSRTPTAPPHLLQSPKRSSSSVLGKRPRDQQPQTMDIDDPTSQSPSKDTEPMSPQRLRSSPELQSPKVAQAEASSSRPMDRDGDVNMDSPPPLPPKPTRKKTEANDSGMMFGRQHDVAECMDNCMFQIETALLKFDDISEASDKLSIVKNLFYGKIRQRLTVPTMPTRASVHDKEDLFSHLPVNVTNDGIDIYDGLSGYFDDIVEFEGRKVRMEVTLVDLPPILQIQLQRVQFNRETLQPYKSQAYVKFGESLFMDRFLDAADPTKKAKSKAIQSELTTCRERVRQLVEGKSTPFAISLEQTRDFLVKLQDEKITEIDSEVVARLDEEKTRIRDEIDTVRNRVDVLKQELENLWRDSKEAEYELTSVFIHRGSSPSFGHYFFYSRHLPENPDSWFKYNDSDVSVVSKDEVLADTTGSTANPYLLVFARKGSNVVDTVKRFDVVKLNTPWLQRDDV